MVKVRIPGGKELADVAIGSLLADPPAPAFECGWLALKETSEGVIDHPQARRSYSQTQVHIQPRITKRSGKATHGVPSLAAHTEARPTDGRPVPIPPGCPDFGVDGRELAREYVFQAAAFGEHDTGMADLLRSR